MSAGHDLGSRAGLGVRLLRWAVAAGLGFAALMGASGLVSDVMDAPAVSVAVGALVGGCTTALVLAGLERLAARR